MTIEKYNYLMMRGLFNDKRNWNRYYRAGAH